VVTRTSAYSARARRKGSGRASRIPPVPSRIDEGGPDANDVERID
jgi:hypothetical protein